MSVGKNNHRINGQSRKPRRTASPRRLSMTIASNNSEKRKAEERILKAVVDSGFSHDSTFAVKLALDEALINAIKHGNRLDPAKKVRLWTKVSPTQVEIIIEDEGPGFSREHVPDPRHEENLEKCSGRGIFLIESYMNQVEWSHGGRRLRMIKRNQPTAAPST
jgi:serine/threonine-protein kinase RsbW